MPGSTRQFKWSWVINGALVGVGIYVLVLSFTNLDTPMFAAMGVVAAMYAFYLAIRGKR